MGDACADGSIGKPVFNAIRTPYVEMRANSGRFGEAKGKRQFQTSPAKKGQTVNPVGSGEFQYRSLYANTKFRETSKMHVKSRLKARSKFMTPNGFRYSSPMKKSATPGDTFGSFSTPNGEADPNARPESRQRTKVSNFETRNICTSPSKKGSYGTAGTLLGPMDNYLGGEYDVVKIGRKGELAEDKAKVGDRSAFVSTARRTSVFDADIYKDDMAPPPPSAMTRKEEVDEKLSTMKIFRPSSPTTASIVMNHSGSLNAFPAHVPDPLDDRRTSRAVTPSRRQPVEVATRRLPESLRSRKPFVPSTIGKKPLTPSVATMNLAASHR